VTRDNSENFCVLFPVNKFRENRLRIKFINYIKKEI